MTKLVAVRIPVDLLAMIDAKGKRTPVILEALRRHLQSEGSSAPVAPRRIEKSAPCRRTEQASNVSAAPPATISHGEILASGPKAREVAGKLDKLPRLGERCPHGWMSALSCPSCNPRR
jgi:hypothetical protein